MEKEREREREKKKNKHTHTHIYSGLRILPKNCMCTALSKDRTNRFKEVVTPFSRPLPTADAFIHFQQSKP